MLNERDESRLRGAVSAALPGPRNREWLSTPETRLDYVLQALRTVFGSIFLNEMQDTSYSDEYLKSLSGTLGTRKAAYVIAHYRHIALPESRATVTLLGNEAQSRTFAAFHPVNPALTRDSVQLTKLHELFASVYFGSIGRADAFTDALVRGLAWWSRQSEKSGYPWPLREVPVVRLKFGGKGSVTTSVDASGLYTITVANEYARQLREAGANFQLDSKFFEYVATSFLHDGQSPATEDGAAGDGSISAEDHVHALRERNILQTREALLDFMAYSAYHNSHLENTLLQIHAALYPEADQELAREVGNSNQTFAGHLFDGRPLRPEVSFHTLARWRIAALRRVLASLQSASLFAKTGHNDFFVYLRRPGSESEGNALPGALVLGGAEKLMDKLTIASDVLEIAFGEIDSRLSPPDEGQGLAEICLSEMQADVKASITAAEKELVKSHETFTNSTFWGAMYLGLQLVGRQHESHPLQFRLAVASDERLRQYFNVIHSVGSLPSDDGKPTHFEVNLSDPAKAINEINRLGALLEANYPFLQDPGLFACCAVTALKESKSDGASENGEHLRPGLVLRYLGVPNPRYRDLVMMHDGAPWSDRFNRHTMQRLSRSMREVLLVLCDNYGRGHALLDGRVAFSAANQRSGWVYATSASGAESKLLYALRAMVKDVHCQNPNHPLMKFLLQDNSKVPAKLCSIILDLSADPGAGAAIAIGTEKVLRDHMVPMTPIFDVSPGWVLEDFRTTDHLFELAVQDGATGIAIGEDGTGGRVLGRMHVTPVLNPERNASILVGEEERFGKPWLDLWDGRDDPDPNPYRWPDWGKWYKWGTRHRSAAALAYAARGNVLAVCISQDGHIHLFDGFGIKAWSPDDPVTDLAGRRTSEESSQA